MSPTPEQICQALANHRQPARTHASRVMAAVSHAKKSRGMSPALDTLSADETQRYQRWQPQGDNPCPLCQL